MAITVASVRKEPVEGKKKTGLLFIWHFCPLLSIFTDCIKFLIPFFSICRGRQYDAYQQIVNQPNFMRKQKKLYYIYKNTLKHPA